MAKSKKKPTKKGRKTTNPRTPKFALKKNQVFALIGVLVITFICFIPSLSADFVNWDDDYNILNNENLKAFRFQDIKGIFTSHVIGNYNPLPILMFAIEKAIFGLNPFVFHVNNVLLHLACTFLVFLIFRRLKLDFLPAIVGALLFGIHPMRVESVAWITERKDVLFGVFSLIATLQYIKYLYTSQKVKKHFYIALVFSVLAMLSKIQAVALPLSFLTIDYLLNRKLNFKLVIEKIPFFALSLVIGLIGIYFLGEQGSLEDKTHYNILQRLIIGAHSYGVYVLKFIFPYKMVPLYPYPSSLPGYFYISPVYAAAVLGGLYWAFRKDYKPIVFGVLFFTFNVMFVLQIVGAGQGFLADRFTYLPYIGFFFIVAYYWNQIIQQKSKFQTIAKVGMAAYLLLFAVMTYIQTGIWKNSATLWTHTIKYYDNTPLPFRNRGNYYRDEGQRDLAMADYNSALALKQEDDGIYNSRAKLYFGQEKYQLALTDYDKAISLDGSKGEYWINRGATKAALGNYQAALSDVTKGIELAPDMSSGYLNRSLLHSTLGQNNKAIQDIEKYLTIEPNHAELWYELGRLKRIQGRNQDALKDFNRALQLNPNHGLFYLERSRAYFGLGNKQQAKRDALQAKQLNIQVDQGYLNSLN
jgi:tetratricopeptide (TPR) repeat protein